MLEMFSAQGEKVELEHAVEARGAALPCALPLPN